MLKGLIFDFDGTLFDSNHVWTTAGECYFRSIGVVPKDDLQEEIRTMSLYQSACYIREEYRLCFSVEEIMAGINRTVEDAYFHQVQPKAGVVPFLHALKAAGTRMCIATATDRYQVEAALKRCGMFDLFEEIFTCSEVGHGKDEPVIYRKAMEFLGTDRGNTAVFEDALHAAQTAKADGFRTVGIYDPHIREQAQLRALCDCYLTDFCQTEGFWKFASAQNR